MMTSWSWWDDTPWSEIYAQAKTSLSRKDFAAWLKRPDVIARMERGK